MNCSRMIKCERWVYRQVRDRVTIGLRFGESTTGVGRLEGREWQQCYTVKTSGKLS